jgi:hypothetical protein
MARPSGGNNSTDGVPPSASDQPIVTIRADKQYRIPETRITDPAPLGRLAQQWGYLLRVRSRWACDPDMRQTIAERAADDLAGVGVSRERLRDLARAHRIEIELHDWKGDDAKASKIHETASEIPWEYLISSGTRAEGRYQSLLITRLFNNGLARVTPHPPKSVLFVESAPGRFKDQYEFDDEEGRIRAAVDAPSKQQGDDGRYWKILPTPQKSELSGYVRDPRQVWEAIHVTGIDTHQAGWCIQDFYADMKHDKEALFKSLLDPAGRLRDGMILREGPESELPVLYDDLAETLVGPTPPRIVTLNLYYSGARIARELVKKGAHVALGFLDEIDDQLAELFFQAFYWKWCHPDKKILSIPDAFLAAWETMPMDSMHGTSIVIWMGRSVFEPGSESIRSVAPRSSARKKSSPRRRRAAR